MTDADLDLQEVDCFAFVFVGYDLMLGVFFIEMMEFDSVDKSVVCGSAAETVAL